MNRWVEVKIDDLKALEKGFTDVAEKASPDIRPECICR